MKSLEIAWEANLKGSERQILTAGKEVQEKDDRRGQKKWNIT